MRKILTTTVYAFLTVVAFAANYDIKTSSVMGHPGTEVLGDYKGSWYVLGFESPGTLNRPPRYQIFKYTAGFKAGKMSVLYPSFGEKTLYLKAAFVNNKISMFYAKCGKREDVSILLDKRDDRRQLPVIMRQDFDPNTLEPIGEAVVVFNEEDEYFAPNGIVISESPDRSKTAILFKPYYKHQRFKVTVYDNNDGTYFTKNFDLKEKKEYLKFTNMKVNNAGNAMVVARIREDVITLAQSTTVKGQTKYYLYGMNKGTGKEPKTTELLLTAEKNGSYRDPIVAALNSGEMVVTYDNLTGEVLRSVTVMKYNDELNATGKQEIQPDSKFIPQISAYHSFKKGKEFSHLETQEILPLAGGAFMLITEYHDTIPNADKTQPTKTERNYILTYRFDESMAMKDEQLIPKKQVSATVDYAFSVKAYAKGNDVYLFYNADWEADEEHNMNLQCTRLGAEGGEPETKKVLNTSGDFFTSMESIFPNSDGRVLVTVEKAVDYEDVSREVKLLEITPK
ncbi:MAG TPA: hypothetical protein VK174_15850 [Chitinophagales bacterium]|nr:hypothetical protein [Chitinophagales bacterium]